MINQSIPCFTDSDDNRFPAEPGEGDYPESYADRSRKYAAAIETNGYYSVKGICRLWEGWRSDPKRLLSMLHGLLIGIGYKAYGDAWHEIDFLVEILRSETDD